MDKKKSAVVQFSCSTVSLSAAIQRAERIVSDSIFRSQHSQMDPPDSDRFGPSWRNPWRMMKLRNDR